MLSRLLGHDAYHNIDHIRSFGSSKTNARIVNATTAIRRYLGLEFHSAYLYQAFERSNYFKDYKNVIDSQPSMSQNAKAYLKAEFFFQFLFQIVTQIKKGSLVDS